MSEILDLRKYNIKDENDALQFLGVVMAKLPQLEKVIKSNRMKLASAVNRAEFAEGKKEDLDQSAAVEEEQSSIGDRITGRVVPKTNVAANRVNQLKAAAAAPAPSLVPAAPAASMGDPAMVTEDEDEGVQLAAALIDASAPVSPGQIGRIEVTPPAPSAPATPLVPLSTDGPVDLAAMAAAQGQSEEDIAAAAGTTPSEHATNNGVQQEDTAATGSIPEAQPYEIKETDLIYDQFFVGEDTFQHVLQEDGDNTVDHYLKNGHHISVQDFHAAQQPAQTPLTDEDKTPVGDRVAREQNNTQV